MIRTNYAVYDPAIERTDIAIVPPDTINMFSRETRPTEFLSATSTVDWLMRAASRFDLTLSRDRNSLMFGYFSQADALTSSLQASEFAFVTVTAALRDALGHEDQLGHPDAVALTRQLTTWLGITYDQLSDITGVSRAAFFYWRRPGAAPRAENVRQVERLYAITSLLVKRFGVKGARSWLHSGQHPLWDQLLAGDLTAVESAVRAQLFRQTSTRGSNELPLDEVYLDLPSLPQAAEPRRARRQPTRGRLRAE
jgi:hypothetical protein